MKIKQTIEVLELSVDDVEEIFTMAFSHLYKMDSEFRHIAYNLCNIEVYTKLIDTHIYTYECRNKTGHLCKYTIKYNALCEVLSHYLTIRNVDRINDLSYSDYANILVNTLCWES